MRRGTTVAAAVFVALVLPASAQADKVIRANTVWMFDAATYTIDQGEKLEFLNADALSPGPHDVTSETKGPDGKPLFASETIPHGSQVPVIGAQQLKTGSYGFFCTVHTFMTATVNVTDKGTPAAPPGTPPPSPPPPPPDTTRPRLTAAIAKARPSATRFGVSVSADEPAKLALKLTAKVRGRTVAVGFGTGFIGQAGKRLTVAIRASDKARKALRTVRRATFALTVTATDGAGNRAATTVRRTLSR